MFRDPWNAPQQQPVSGLREERQVQNFRVEHCSQGAQSGKIDKLSDLLHFGNGTPSKYIHHQKEVKGGSKIVLPDPDFILTPDGCFINALQFG